MRRRQEAYKRRGGGTRGGTSIDSLIEGCGLGVVGRDWHAFMGLLF